MTETSVMQDIELCLEQLARLRDAGVHLAIDDFGTGQSSLQYVQLFPVESVKLDGSFTARVASDDHGQAIMGTMILLFGNAFGAHATAYALTGGLFNLATLLIGQQISGDVLHNPGLGYAVAMGMVMIMALSIVIYSILQRRSERWLR